MEKIRQFWFLLSYRTKQKLCFRRQLKRWKCAKTPSASDTHLIRIAAAWRCFRNYLGNSPTISSGVTEAKFFCQKIEDRELGNTRGIQGYIKWNSESEAKPRKFNFLFLEYEHADESGCFAVERCIKVHLKLHDQGSPSKDIVKIFQKFYSVFGERKKSTSLNPVTPDLI